MFFFKLHIFKLYKKGKCEQHNRKQVTFTNMQSGAEQNVQAREKMFGLMHHKLETRKCRAKCHCLILKVLRIIGFPGIWENALEV